MCLGLKYLGVNMTFIFGLDILCKNKSFIRIEVSKLREKNNIQSKKENKECKDCMLLLVVYDLVLFYYFFDLPGDLRYLYTLIS
jgi:hypothetical protein